MPGPGVGQVAAALLWVVLVGLGTYRLTRLLTKDDFPPLRWLRHRTTRLGVRWEWVEDLVTCHWCASGWITAALVGGSAVVVGVPLPWLVWPAAWAVGAWLAHVEPDVKA
jgi:hypothetical protein